MTPTTMTTSARDATALEPMPFADAGPCWICGGAELDRVWRDPFDLTDFPRFGAYAHAGHPPSWLVRCRACGFGQPESLPAIADFFETLYDISWGREALDREFDCGYKDLIFREVLEGLERRRSEELP